MNTRGSQEGAVGRGKRFKGREKAQTREGGDSYVIKWRESCQEGGEGPAEVEGRT